ncbi:MAG TPA: hypothetical protein ENH13_07320 [Euryarchaeota archaeon]|nr:hypothetical protein [Euryarchaeota archaeon]
MCPVCGYDLDFEPWSGKRASHDNCPSCGIEFGYHDVPAASGAKGSREEIYLKWREKWVSDGMKWSISEWSRPSNWDPMEQLKQIKRGLR